MPAAHSPPMPMPKSARSPKSIAYDVEKPLRNAKIENQRIDSSQRQLAAPLVGRVPATTPPIETHQQRHRAERAGQHRVDREAPSECR